MEPRVEHRDVVVVAFVELAVDHIDVAIAEMVLDELANGPHAANQG